MEKPLIKNITVTGISSQSYADGGTKTILEAGRDKYFFYNRKKDTGEMTVAQQGFNELQVQIGITYPVAVFEQPATFQDPKTGKTVNYTKRQIAYFVTDREKLEQSQAPAPRPVAPATPSISDVGVHQKLDEILSYLRPKAAPVSPRFSPTATTPTVLPPASQKTESTMHPDIPTINLDDERDEIKIEDVPF